MKSDRRIDIDVLRAISVISVIIFHLDNRFFSLGYLGVDIFIFGNSLFNSKNYFSTINRIRKNINQ